MQAWACAVGILSLSESLLGRQFYYSKGAFRRSDECNLCFENDCLILDQPRCEYYTETTKLLSIDKDDPEGPEDLVIKKEVDELIFDMVEKATGLPNMECIPYVSRYTDCNKENLCIGCKICSCNPDGIWICEISQKCEIQDLPLNIDHRVLVMVLENLINERPKKKKRSISETPDEGKLNGSAITLEQVSEWFYGVKPLAVAIANKTTKTTMNQEENTAVETSSISGLEVTLGLTTEVAPETLGNTDTDYVAFDEVLRSIAVDNKSYNRRKLPMDNELANKTFDIDYMLIEDDNVTNDNSTDQLALVVNFMNEGDAVTEPTLDEATKIIIDLLETAAQSDTNINETQEFEILNHKNEDIANAFENTNDIEYNAANIMKRDVSAVSTISTATVVPIVTLIVNKTNSTNTSEPNVNLKENVLKPLTSIIKDKKKELENLKNIKKNLQKFITTATEKPEVIEKESNDSFPYFSLYNVAMEAGEDIDLRRANPNGIDKIMFKLKTDVLEVIKDIMAIRQQKNSQIPEDLKVLLHAMKRYVKYNFNDTAAESSLKNRRKMSGRRQMEPATFSRCSFLSFRDCVVQIIDAIDRDMPKFNALSPLTPASKRIMKDLIKRFYVDDLTAAGLKVNDPQYNLTNDLTTIGKKWQEMTASVMSGTPFVCIFRMKLLHFALTTDISKLKAAAALVDFAHSRRMLHTIDNVNDDVLERISTGLQAIHNKIQIIIRYYGKKPDSSKTIWQRNDQRISTGKPIEDIIDSRKKKKRSFIKHIRSLLKSSKNDIAELLHRRVPKSEIVRQLARKKLDEISAKRYNEYEETMKRWQKNLDLIPRIKRSLLETFQARIKNIIPSYLRYKVTPKIKEKRDNATSNAAVRKAEKKKNHMEKRKKAQKSHDRKSRKTTTPRVRKSSEVATPKPKMTKLTTHGKPTTATNHAKETTVTAAPLNHTTKH